MQSFGLQNTGVICFFNSLIQGLISCPSFVKRVEEKAETDISKALSDFLMACKGKNINILTVVPILKQIAIKYPFFGHQQEDASEGFDLLIDNMGTHVESIFTSKWRFDVYCDICKNMVSTTNDTMNRLIMEKSFIPLYDDHDPFEAYMSANMSEFNDYKCDVCKGGNVRGMRVARLIKPPDVYVVSFNKFMGKWRVPYSETVRVRYGFKYDKSVTYTLVAVIRHFGSQERGHYNATVIRSNGTYKVDDTSVTPEPFSTTDNDYILMYQRLIKN
jgi:ubiquitin C-terminal hydrolase